MRLTVATLIAVLYVGATRAGPLSSNKVGVVVPGTFPIVDLTSVKGTPNVTLSGKDAKPDVVQQDPPATLFLCRDRNCVDCEGIDLATVPERQCLTLDLLYNSAIISEPSNSGLSFEVYIAPPGCNPLYQLPAVNICYFTPAPFDSYART
ncbi:hypothetical protein BN946_scf184783.g15 [Trametes cinnabarina]|uniref:Uncharacterized protein n=1 Tax=Pycnoporus cinnabarinus TaxID=5643 RepID=A0A060S7B8_PYCCI|nr:hypothetical protein BN946_scf184783.g15 [Trametes cinnabarina]